MMKIKRLALLKSVAGLLTGCIVVSLPVGCMPVPSYSVDPYAGSLKQCLNIEGTYEKGLSLSAFLPSSFSALVYAKRNEKLFSLEDSSRKSEENLLKKMWLTIRFIGDQRIEAILFNVDGQSVKSTFNMREKRKQPEGQEEEFICNQQSWQKSFTRFSYGESGRDKWRAYSKVTKFSDGSLKREGKNDTWGGAFGLYHSGKINVDTVSFYRKVDLAVDDIRAGNEKARRAIEQYDQVATTPPPQ